MWKRVLSSELSHHVGCPVRLSGWVHRLRDFGGVRFLVLRDRGGLAQVVAGRDVDLGNVGCEWVVAIEGTVRREARAPGGCEVHAERVAPVAPAEPPPLEVFRPPGADDAHRLETLLDHRAVSLRIPEVLEVFRAEAEVLRAFREHLRGEDFVEIKTPKLATADAEGGAAVFAVDYFGRRATLAQSPQFYKQMMVGSGLERVFEVGAAYRAEKSETSRHITEFVSLDFEMGFIESEHDVIDVHAGLVRAILAHVAEACGEVLARRGVELRVPEEIPRIPFTEAKRLLALRFGKTGGLEGDLDTEGERLIGRWAREELGSELVYVTGYATAKRPAYTMPDEADLAVSRSFDLLYKGVEITTGGQRIHDHGQLVAALRGRGIDPDGCAGYLEAFRCGMPPHGGMGMGLERLTMQMLDLASIKEACLFPRDRGRLTP